MAYSKTNWENLPSTNTPITASNLNNIETGIKDNDDMLLGNKPMGSIIVEGISSKNLCEIQKANNIVIATLPAGTYTFSLYSTVSAGFNLKENNSGGSTIVTKAITANERTSATFTISQTTSIYLNGYGAGSASFSDVTSDYQLEKGSSATSYVEYKKYGNGIVDSGTRSFPNGSDRYIKYADGTMICSGRTIFTFGFTIWSAWANAYNSGDLNMVDFPQQFVGIPYLVGSVAKASGQWGGWWTGVFTNTTETNPGVVNFLRYTQTDANVAQYGVNYTAIGRWK